MRNPIKYVSDIIKGHHILKEKKRLEKEKQLTENDIHSEEHAQKLKEIIDRRVEIITKWLPGIRIYLGDMKDYSTTYGPVEEIPRDPSAELISIDTNGYGFFSYKEKETLIYRYPPISPNHRFRSSYGACSVVDETIQNIPNVKHRVLYPLDEIEKLHEQGLVAIVMAQKTKSEWWYSERYYGIPVRKKVSSEVK